MIWVDYSVFVKKRIETYCIDLGEVI